MKNTLPKNKGMLDKQSCLSNEKKSSATHLFEDILNGGSSLRVKVTGRSMAPFLNGGDITTIKNIRCTSLHIGDLIFYKNNQQTPILHRILHKRRGSDGSIIFHTKGDALSAFDEPVISRKVLGKVIQIEKTDSMDKMKCIDMESKHQRILNLVVAITGLAKWCKFYVIGGLKNITRRARYSH